MKRTRAKYCRERIKSSKLFDPRSFRVKIMKKHRAVFGCPKGKWDAKRNVCKVPMQLQSILHPVGEKKCPVAGVEIGKPKKENPKKMVKIYDNIEAIEAQKGKDSLWPGEHFRHDFNKSKGKAAVYGLPDGSLLIKGKKRLWKMFNYED